MLRHRNWRGRNFSESLNGFARRARPADYVVMGGMTQSGDHLAAAERNLRGFLDRGARIVIAGGGADRYDDAEVVDVRARMRDLPVHCFVSRDTYS